MKERKEFPKLRFICSIAVVLLFVTLSVSLFMCCIIIMWLYTLVWLHMFEIEDRQG